MMRAAAKRHDLAHYLALNATSSVKRREEKNRPPHVSVILCFGDCEKIKVQKSPCPTIGVRAVVYEFSFVVAVNRQLLNAK